MAHATTDLLDAHPEAQAVEPLFRDFGGARAFSGQIATVKCYEDNSLVREALSEPGNARVLVVDGGGSLKCALLGDQLGELAVKNGWAGVVVFGCVRDTEALGRISLGVKALTAHPRKSEKRGRGVRNVVLRFAGATFMPDAWLYADPDGIVVSDTAIHA